MHLHRSGILLVDKPEGPSSARVVATAKRLTGARKVGHLGTLDPFASGLLPLAVNEGTKIAQYFLDADKGYTGVMTLGAETDTQDRTGKLLFQRDPPLLGRQEIESLRREFSGCLQQVPPMYSALKKDGARLYELARKGMAVGREARPVRVEFNRLEQVGPCQVGVRADLFQGDLCKDSGGGHGPVAGLRGLPQPASPRNLRSVPDRGRHGPG